MSANTYIECPCCGSEVEPTHIEGFLDGDELTCGCLGYVHVDEDGEAWVWLEDTEECPECGPEGGGPL